MHLLLVYSICSFLDVCNGLSPLISNSGTCLPGLSVAEGGHPAPLKFYHLFTSRQQ